MDAMTDEERRPAQHPFRNRHEFGYASHKSSPNLDIDYSTQSNVPYLSEGQPAPISPRWDSLFYGPSLVNQPSTSSLASVHADMSFQPFAATDRSILSPQESSPRNFRKGAPHSPKESPSRSVQAKTSLADMRAIEASLAMDNFSRPRKSSIRHNGPDGTQMPDSLNPRSINHSSSTDRLYDISNSMHNLIPQTPPWQRPRGPSISSTISSSTYASSVPHMNGEFGEPRPHRARNVTGPPALTPARPPFPSGRAENNTSIPFASPGLGGALPWVSSDELRSSFRSQLTASTTPGTAVTERSSVLTKDSSVASLENPDEPSLEDVMGMYEKGFADDEDDEESDFEDHQTRGHQGSRPMTAVSEPDKYLTTVIPGVPKTPAISSNTHLTPPLPTTRSALDSEIRQSRLIFTSPAFMSSVAAISSKDGADSLAKHDSAKSLDSESFSAPSVVEEKKIDSTTYLQSTTSSYQSPSSPPTPPATTATPSPPPVSLAPPTMPIESEDPGSRDRYGFKKANQSINRDEYDAWNKEYSVYLSRRRRKWVAYLRDCALMTDRPIRFPAPSAKTKRFIRKGIPPDWRGAAWFYYAGGPAILAKHSGLYEKLLHQPAKQVDVEAIERDLHRTFPDNIQFKPSTQTESTSSSQRSSQSGIPRSSSGPQPATPNEPPMITSLRRVLHAFSVYNPRIGYCQSLNFLAGLLLLFVETEEQCFWLLNVITIIYLPGTHDISLEGSKVDLGVLMTELRDSLPSVWEKIGGELESLPNSRPETSKSVRKQRPILRRREPQPALSTERLPPITLCMTAWFMSCYIGTLPIETTLRVWDVFFYEGSQTLFRIALSIFKVGEGEIKAVKDPMEMFGVVQAIPRRMIDANALMEACFKRRNGFGHLSQGVIDGRRQERRNKARQERAADLQRSKQGVSGNVTEIETEPLPRRETLFSRKKRDASSTRPSGTRRELDT